jgi:hypothetical protein
MTSGWEGLVGLGKPDPKDTPLEGGDPESLGTSAGGAADGQVPRPGSLFIATPGLSGKGAESGKGRKGGDALDRMQESEAFPLFSGRGLFR